MHHLLLKDVTLFGLKILVYPDVAIVGIILSASANFELETLISDDENDDGDGGGSGLL